jgi:hypothetical protein
MMMKSSYNKIIWEKFIMYRNSHNATKLGFYLSYEQFYDLVIKPCVYCGKEGDYKSFNGIDRLDSTLGYIISNCLTCCTKCNQSKGNLSVSKFIKHMSKRQSVIIAGKVYK